MKLAEKSMGERGGFFAERCNSFVGDKKTVGFSRYGVSALITAPAL
jgi:hypothetical protein